MPLLQQSAAAAAAAAGWSLIVGHKKGCWQYTLNPPGRSSAILPLGTHATPFVLSICLLYLSTPFVYTIFPHHLSSAFACSIRLPGRSNTAPL